MARNETKKLIQQQYIWSRHFFLGTIFRSTLVSVPFKCESCVYEVIVFSIVMCVRIKCTVTYYVFVDLVPKCNMSWSLSVADDG